MSDHEIKLVPIQIQKFKIWIRSESKILSLSPIIKFYYEGFLCHKFIIIYLSMLNRAFHIRINCLNKSHRLSMIKGKIRVYKMYTSLIWDIRNRSNQGKIIIESAIVDVDWAIPVDVEETTRKAIVIVETSTGDIY